MNLQIFHFCSVVVAASMTISCETSGTSQTANTSVPQPSATAQSTPSPTARPSPSPTATPIPLSEQKAPDWEISSIKIVPFDWNTGEFRDEIESNDGYGGGNEFSVSLFVVVEVSNPVPYALYMKSEKMRKVEITVMEGKRQKAKKIEEIIVIGEGGKIFVPVWLDPVMCEEVKIKARITGQKTASTMKRTVLFECGE